MAKRPSGLTPSIVEYRDWSLAKILFAQHQTLTEISKATNIPVQEVKRKCEADRWQRGFGLELLHETLTAQLSKASEEIARDEIGKVEQRARALVALLKATDQFFGFAERSRNMQTKLAHLNKEDKAEELAALKAELECRLDRLAAQLEAKSLYPRTDWRAASAAVA